MTDSPTAHLNVISKCYFFETMRGEDTVDTVPSPFAQNRDPFRLPFTICSRQGATIITSVYERVARRDYRFRLGR